MPTRTRGATAVLAALALTACAALPPVPGLPERPIPGVPAPTDVPGGVTAGIEAEVHDRVNRFRASHSLAGFSRDPVLDRLAREHSARMAAGEYPFGHDGFEERLARARSLLGISRMSENVAVNDYPPADVARVAVNGWVTSPGHLRNLRGDFEFTGVGTAVSRSGDYFVTQVYAAR